MATFSLTINGQSTTRTVPDDKALAVLTALGEASGLPDTATVKQKVEAGLNTMLQNAVTAARAYRKAGRYLTVTTEVDQELALE